MHGQQNIKIYYVLQSDVFFVWEFVIVWNVLEVSPWLSTKLVLRQIYEQLNNVCLIYMSFYNYILYFLFPPNATTTCSYELSWFPSWLWR